MEDMERKCEKMEIKYEETIQDQIMYERVIEELIQIQDSLYIIFFQYKNKEIYQNNI